MEAVGAASIGSDLSVGALHRAVGETDGNEGEDDLVGAGRDCRRENAKNPEKLVEIATPQN